MLGYKENTFNVEYKPDAFVGLKLHHDIKTN